MYLANGLISLCQKCMLLYLASFTKFDEENSEIQSPQKSQFVLICQTVVKH